MKPYYEDELTTIYHGRCEDILPTLGEFDLIFTSPPYNMGISTGGGFGHYADGAAWGSRGGGGKWGGGALASGYEDHSDDMPLDEYEAWQRECVKAMWNHLGPAGAIFYNHKPRVQKELWLPLVLNPGLPLRQIITWARAGGVNFAPTHYLPTYEWIMVLAKEAWRLKSKAASGLGDVWRVPQEANTVHPCPFPIGLPARAIESSGPGSVLDPFMGSGTTLVAAKAAGVQAVGIEKSEMYCEMAIKRLGSGGSRMTADNLFGMPMLFHGGTPGLRKGDLIVPHAPNLVDGCAVCEAHRIGAEVAVGGQIIDPANHAPEFVFATSDREYARFYASKFPHGDLYVVEPSSDLIPSEADPFPTWMAPTLTVRATYDRRVELTMAQRRRLWKRWPDEMWRAS